MSRVGNSLIGFLSKLIVFCVQKKQKSDLLGKKRNSNLLGKKANCSHHSYVMSEGENRSRLLLFKEQQEGCTPGCSFVKNNKFELLLSLFKKEQVSAE